MRRFIFGLLLLSGFLPMAMAAESTPAAAQTYTVDSDFERVVPQLPTDQNGKVQVTEFFWYGCPHCYQFEPFLEAWLKEKPAYVDFVRVPAIFGNPVWEAHARAYYTAQVLGVLDKIHEPLFDAIHKEHKRIATKEELRDFFAQYGVDPATFDKTYDSFAVDAKISRARDLTQRSGIGGVPAILVDGRYRVQAPQAKSYKALLETSRWLAEQVHEGKAP